MFKSRCWTPRSPAARTSPMLTLSPSSSSAASSCWTSSWLSSWTTLTTSPGWSSICLQLGSSQRTEYCDTSPKFFVPPGTRPSSELTTSTSLSGSGQSKISAKKLSEVKWNWGLARRRKKLIVICRYDPSATGLIHYAEMCVRPQHDTKHLQRHKGNDMSWVLFAKKMLKQLHTLSFNQAKGSSKKMIFFRNNS